MANLDTEVDIRPHLEAELGPVLMVKYAIGAQPIHRWVPTWTKPADAPATYIVDPAQLGDFYVTLMAMVAETMSLAETEGKTIDSITLLWMQGESDGIQGLATHYQRSLEALHEQLERDLRRPVLFVLGRIHEGPTSRMWSWNRVREHQAAFAQYSSRRVMFNTDDIPRWTVEDIESHMHYKPEGYVILGERFANAALDRILDPPILVAKSKVYNNVDFALDLPMRPWGREWIVVSSQTVEIVTAATTDNNFPAVEISSMPAKLFRTRHALTGYATKITVPKLSRVVERYYELAP